MKILYLSDDFPPKSYGGAGIIAYNDARALAAKGHEVTVITTSNNAADVGVKKFEGLTIHTLFSDYDIRWRHFVSLNNKKVVKEVSRIIDEVKPDVVHSHNIHLHISYKSLQIATQKVKKVFLTAHDLMMVHYGKMVVKDASGKISQIELVKDYGLAYNPFRTWIIKKYIKNLTQIFAVSGALKNILVANGIKNVEVLHNGIDVTEWKANDADVLAFRQDMGLAGKKVILFGGRMSAPKGARALLDAFSKMTAKHPEARLLLVGKLDPQVIDFLQTYTEEVKAAVVMTGWIDRRAMKVIYSASDVVVVPSLYLDPFPTVNLEAMATKKPVVGTIFGGTPEVVEDEVTGFLVDPNDTELLKEKISELLTDSKKATSFGLLGFERVSEKFTLNDHIEKLLVWYTDSKK